MTRLWQLMLELNVEATNPFTRYCQTQERRTLLDQLSTLFLRSPKDSQRKTLNKLPLLQLVIPLPQTIARAPWLGYTFRGKWWIWRIGMLPSQIRYKHNNHTMEFFLLRSSIFNLNTMPHKRINFQKIWAGSYLLWLPHPGSLGFIIHLTKHQSVKPCLY